MKEKSAEDILIEVWNRLEGMWQHDQDGSTFFPKKFDDKYSENWKKNYEEIQRRGEKCVHFDIIFNEIQHTVKAGVSKERQKELN